MLRVFIVSGNYYLLLLTAAMLYGWMVGGMIQVNLKNHPTGGSSQ
jgi:hypothetical protein